MSEPVIPTPQAPVTRDDFDIMRATQEHINQKASTPPPAPTEPVEQFTIPQVEDKPTTPVSKNPLESLLSKPEAKPSVPGDDHDVEEFEKSLPQPYEGMAPKTRESWDKMRESMKQTKKEALQAKREREDFAKQIEELKKNPVSTVDDVEFKRIKEERETLLKKNAVWELELDPKFQANIETPLNAAYQSLDALVDTFKLDPAKVDAAFRAKPGPERNKALNEIVEEANMTPFDIEDFKKATGSIIDLAFKKQQAYQNATTLNEAATQRVKEEASKKQQVSQKQLDEADSKFWDKLTKDVRVVKDILKDTSYANELRDMVKSHRSSEPDPEVRMLADYAPYLLPKVVELVEARDAEIANLKNTIKTRIGSDAPAGGGHPAVAKPAAEEKLAPGEDIGRAFSAWRAGQR